MKEENIFIFHSIESHPLSCVVIQIKQEDIDIKSDIKVGNGWEPEPLSNELKENVVKNSKTNRKGLKC